MTVGPIPVSKIKQYLREEFELSGDELDRALGIIRALDNAYVSLGSPARKDPDDEKMRDKVKFSDAEGVKKMVRRLGKKHGKTLTK